MPRISAHGEVTRFDLARTLAGRGRYWTAAHLVRSFLAGRRSAVSRPPGAAPLR